MSAGVRVRFFEEAAEFLDVAADHLATEPVVSTVVATNAARIAATGRDPRVPHTWFATVEAPDGTLAGAAMRTAPFAPYPPYLLPMPEPAAVALADALIDRGEDLGGVSGTRPAADAFAARVAERTGTRIEPGMHTRLFELGDLVEPAPAAGALRAPRPDEEPLVLEWIRRFFLDADAQAGRPPGSGHDPDTYSLADVARRNAEGVLWFWVDADDRPVHLTGANPPAYGVARIGPVFTPAELRGRGYGGTAVAAVSRRLRDAGHRVTLFTDQANPVSNRLYLALGYHAVVDTIELHLA